MFFFIYIWWSAQRNLIYPTKWWVWISSIHLWLLYRLCVPLTKKTRFVVVFYLKIVLNSKQFTFCNSSAFFHNEKFCVNFQAADPVQVEFNYCERRNCSVALLQTLLHWQKSLSPIYLYTTADIVYQRDVQQIKCDIL